MGNEQDRHKESIPRGVPFVLSHPGSDHFSGYGLTLHEGRADILAGLVMVDRPHPVDPAWLQEVEQVYGDAQLWPMTRSGERGLITQMRVQPDSLPHLQPMAPALAQPMAEALKSLLDEPPAPILKMSWDEENRVWQSEFWIGLPPALQDLFEHSGPGCLAIEQGETVAFVTHAADEDIDSFRNAAVSGRWELVEMPTAPLIRYRAVILDDPQAPYLFENFLNIADPEQARCLAGLAQQENLVFDFFGSDYEYRISSEIAHDERMRARLDAITRRAVDLYGQIPAGQRDFDRAKAEFQRDYPL